MVYVVETSEYAPGKRDEAVAFLKKAAAYYRKMAGVDLHITQRMAPSAGQQAKLTAISTLDSLGAWDEFLQARKKDPEWQGLVRDIFVPDKGFWTHNSYTRTFFEVI
jgi:hypothetical protein